MAATPATAFAQAFRRLVQQVDDGDHVAALPQVRELVQDHAGSAQVVLLLATCLSRCGHVDEADAAFARAASLAPQDASVRLHHAVHLRLSGRGAQGVAQCAMVTQRLPAAAAGWVELARCAQAADDLPLALGAWQMACKCAPADADIALEFAQTCHRIGEYDTQVAVLEAVRRHHPGDARVLAGLAMALRQAGRPRTAVERIDAAALDDVRVADVRAGALADLGHTEQAIAQARDTLRRYPDFAPVRRTLAGMVWEADGAICANAVYQQTLRDAPDAHPLRLDYARFLLESRQPQAALEQARRLRAASPDDAVLQVLEAAALDAIGDHASAALCHERIAPILALQDASYARLYTRHLLARGDWSRAEAMARQAVTLDPAHQEGYAYLATAWRLLDDPREFWLCDYQRHAATLQIEPPQGYASLEAFLVQLRAALEGLHDAAHAPATQSVRGGTQTAGRLFGEHRPAVVQAARECLLRAVTRHLAGLPRDAAHPFLSRNTRQVRISGSWSVRLRGSGHHAHHVHDEGWLSSACYIALPPSMQAADAGDAGTLCLGQPPAELGLDLPPRRIIHPQPGMLAVFPSYMWHGTQPFVDAGTRLTIAFDMIPAVPLRAARQEPA